VGGRDSYQLILVEKKIASTKMNASRKVADLGVHPTYAEGARDTGKSSIFLITMRRRKKNCRLLRRSTRLSRSVPHRSLLGGGTKEGVTARGEG